jgi:hypothetical protein
MEPEEAAALRQALIEHVTREFGDERTVINLDAIDFMAQSLQRVYRLEIDLFAATEPDAE